MIVNVQNVAPLNDLKLELNMASEAIYIDESNNRWQFRIDGRTVFIYAECYESALKKLKEVYPNLKGIE